MSQAIQAFNCNILLKNLPAVYLLLKCIVVYQLLNEYISDKCMVSFNFSLYLTRLTKKFNQCVNQNFYRNKMRSI